MLEQQQIMEVARRLTEMREINGMTIEELAARLHITPEEFKAYESGNADIPISFLLAFCNQFGIELAALLTGNDPKLHVYTLTKAGEGKIVDRLHGYNYQSLAYNMSGKVAEPFLVTTDPTPEGTPMVTNRHAGQEFDYVLEGALRIVIDNKELLLHPGDSVYFDSAYPHAIQAVDGKPAKFLAFVM